MKARNINVIDLLEINTTFKSDILNFYVKLNKNRKIPVNKMCHYNSKITLIIFHKLWSVLF